MFCFSRGVWVQLAWRLLVCSPFLVFRAFFLLLRGIAEKEELGGGIDYSLWVGLSYFVGLIAILVLDFLYLSFLI